MSLVDADGNYDIYHGGLRARAADGSLIFDHEDYCGYTGLISEEVKSWSYMKFPFIQSPGYRKRLVSGRTAGAAA